MIATATKMSEPVPEELQELLREHVESIDQLEVLALLSQQAPRGWAPEEVSAQLRLPGSTARAALQHLCGVGLLTVAALDTEEFSYRPVSPELRERTERLIRLYAVERAAVMRLLSSNAIARLRAGALSAFVSAKKEGGER